jgi:DNA ligase D-like protein (predicted 3'-phosphoesterase)
MLRSAMGRTKPETASPRSPRREGHYLVEECVRRGREVKLFASGAPGRSRPTHSQALGDLRVRLGSVSPCNRSPSSLNLRLPLRSISSADREPLWLPSTLGPRVARFVVQKHAARRLHYDLRLELDGVFKSLAVTKRPSLDPKVKAARGRGSPARLWRLRRHDPQGQYGGGTAHKVGRRDRKLATRLAGLGEIPLRAIGCELPGRHSLVLK